MLFVLWDNLLLHCLYCCYCFFITSSFLSLPFLPILLNVLYVQYVLSKITIVNRLSLGLDLLDIYYYSLCIFIHQKTNLQRNSIRLDGNSETGGRVGINFCNLICLRHWIFSPKRTMLLSLFLQARHSFFIHYNKAKRQQIGFHIMYLLLLL